MDWMKELYSDVAIEYAKNESFRGKIENALSKEGKNISCGDEVTLYLKIDDDKIVDASFEGSGCIVSQASAAMLVEMVKGKNVDEIRKIMENVDRMMKGEEYDEDVLGNLVIFSSIRKYPVRSKCFALAWKTLEDLLRDYKGEG